MCNSLILSSIPTSKQRGEEKRVSRKRKMEQNKTSVGLVGRLPPGFRFHPTDEELIVQYLTRKVFSFPLPASIIPEIDLAKHAPWDLPGGFGQDRYLFALREGKYPKGNRTNRATVGVGYWKATGKDRVVVAASRSNQVVGVKKSLVFYQGKAPNGSRTDWIMHEYCLAGIGSSRTRASFPQTQRKNVTHNLGVPPREWVLCRIFKKKRATKMGEDRQEHAEENRATTGFIDFLGRNRSTNSPSGSESSCVTEGAEELSNGENTSSYTTMM